MNENSSSFCKLHKKIQRWIWKNEWTELRDIQEKAIDPILNASTDVIIAAATAGGKTEAAYFPILSYILENHAEGIRVLYISPLKALINDQYNRLELVCNNLEIPITSWHGDASAQKKRKLLSNPSGILLITPESLEAIHINNGYKTAFIFKGLSYIIVDELHSYFNSERGRQLLSLMHRIEVATKRKIPRIALSATLGDMNMAAEFLRPGSNNNVYIIQSSHQQKEIKLQIRGYEKISNLETESSHDNSNNNPENKTEHDIAEHLFSTLRGSGNLVFTNSRRDVEIYTDKLRIMSNELHVPCEFFPHHGSLSKEIRENAEDQIKQKSLPVNIICTSTLEMGIDIGNVKSIAQIDCPYSVNSMRQRLGRSGRLDTDPSILRVYIQEREITAKTSPQDMLRTELVQSIAMVQLLINKWCEPPFDESFHFSTLVQQTLSLIAQYGGVKAIEAFNLLCVKGPFSSVNQTIFAQFLKNLGSLDLITQTHDGDLVLGKKGERIINHYSFYTAFTTPEEYRLIYQGKTLGTLPIVYPLSEGMFIIFAGKRWNVISVNNEKKIIELAVAKGGRPPKFSGMGTMIHDKIRQEMFKTYNSTEIPAFLDRKAKELLKEGRNNFKRFKLAENQIIPYGKNSLFFPWVGDKILYTLMLQLRTRDLKVSNDGVSLQVLNTNPDNLLKYFKSLFDQGVMNSAKLASIVENKKEEKHDDFLPNELLTSNYALKKLNTEGAWKIIQSTLAQKNLCEQ